MARENTGDGRKYVRVSLVIAQLTLAVSATSLISATPSIAGQTAKCVQQIRGAVVDDCGSEPARIGENTESAQISESRPFVISVDGEPMAAGGVVDNQRQTDVALDAVDIQVKFDGLDAKQILNVRADIVAGATKSAVTFQTSTNYDQFIARREIRVYDGKDTESYKVLENDPLAIIPVSADGTAVWAPEGGGVSDLVYVLRAYDDDGRYDETTVQSFSDRNAKLPTDFESNDGTADLTRVNNIPVYGGAITVYGRNIPAGYDVNVLGQSVKLDSENKFLFQQIMPAGDHDVSVSVSGGKSDDLQFVRQVNIPKNDWFYVGLADFTVGHNFGSAVESVNPDEFEKTYTKGRLAFYLKGKIKGKYLLTAAADTGEGKIGELFKGFDRKDVDALLRHLDPNDYYPIYGDDSTITEDAPTSGKAYIRLERGDSHVMWGNFKTTISGTEFARNERSLYGAHAIYKSEQSTGFSEPKTKFEAYAAQPGTVPQRDDFRGTNGSAYFLKRQDINSGTEQIVIERRDSLSGRVISRVPLKEGTDYSIDYIQGVVILNTPLGSTAASSGSLSGGGTGSDELHLIVNYETTPTIAQEDGQTLGARGEHWLGDHIKIGGTATKETISGETNKKIEADLTLRMSDKTDIQFEVAQSQGRGIGQSFSNDGGLTFTNETVVGSIGAKANAYRVKARADLGEISNGKLSGSADAYYEFREKGFSALESETATDRQIFGGNLALNVTDNVVFRMGLEGLDAGPDSRNYRAKAEAEAEIAENWTLVAGVTWSKFQEPGKLYRNGDRVDVGARLSYKVDEDTSIYVFGQKTLSKSGDRLNNDRVGLGGETQLNERFGLAGEVSYGNTGIGGSAAVTYKRDSDNSYYLGYKLDPDRDTYTDTTTTFTGTDNGVIIAGANTRLNDWTTAFTETNADLFGKTRKMGQIYGLTFAPDKMWTSSLGISFSTVKDDVASDFDRKAVSLRVGYSTEKLVASFNGEARVERSEDHTRDRDTYLFQSAVNWKTDENWRMLASVDAVLSQSDQSSILDGDYIKASVGAAYRPIDNDKLNMLFRYTYLYDLPGAQQVNASGNLLGPSQRSHILSADVTYDVNDWLTVGGKYGFRTGSISKTRAVQDFETSTVHLGILRADVNIVKNWDLLAEGRVLYSAQSKQTDFGLLAAAYRHFGNNMKVGVGYNFGKFSDDLSDVTYNDRGVFFNVIGKF